MDFDLSDDQRQLRDEARRFLEREAPITYARAMMDDARGYRDDIWKQTAELGWTALPFAEQHGGLDLGFIALTLLVAEMGRVVLPGPYLATVLAGLAIADGDDDGTKERFLPRIASGDLFATLVHDAGGRFAIDGALAEVVVLCDSDGMSVAEPGARADVQTMDLTRRTAHVTLDRARAQRIGDAAAAQRALDRAAVLLSAEMLGAAERVVELATEYAKDRQQFGRPIGSFQAIKHRLADMLVDVESMRNAVYYAAWALERGAPDAGLAASMAKACASDAALRVAKGGIQVHGGIGFTWEHDMHLFFKRIKFDEQAFGDATHHRERMATLLRARVGQG